MVLIVTYDLHQYGRDYPAIAEVLRSASGGYAHPQGSVWFIDTLDTPESWVNRLRQAGDNNDECFVAQMAARQWASYNQDNEVSEWLHSPQRRW